MHILSGQAVVLCLFVFGQVSGTAPGDETCSLQPHATNVIVLMDSFNYNTLLNSVWTTQNYDGSGVTWTPGTGGNCQATVVVSSSAASSSGWLFTQLISKNVSSNVNTYPINISLTVTARFNCAIKVLTVYKYVPSTLGSAYNDSSKYSIIGNITTTSTLSVTFSLSFTVQPGENYFYVAFRGSCLFLQRVIIYRSSVQPQQVGLLIYPEVPVPTFGSASVTGTCSPYSGTVSGNPPILVASSQGQWVNNGGELCYCMPGYQYNPVNNVCTVCTAGTFKSTLSNNDTCQQCPLNSMSSQPGASVCPCNSGYLRPPLQPAQDCIQPPSSPQVYSSNTVYTTTNSITPCWLSPSNAGGSPQGLYYNIYIQDLGTQSNQCLAKVNSSNSNAVGAICSTVSGLKSSTLYAVYVVAANAATVDPDTVCNITVLDGRYLAVVTETQSDAISAQTSANINTAAAVSITFFITFIVAVVAVVVAILVTWIITRNVSHEKEFNLQSNTSYK